MKTNRDISKFAILRYVPDMEREEFINIGLVLHNPAKQFLELRTATAFSRIRAFDDEIDINFFKAILNGLKSEFNSKSSEGPSREQLHDFGLLDELTRHYVNQIQFSDVRVLMTRTLDEDFKDLFNTYVYYETPKPNRIDSERVNSILYRTFRENKIHNYLKRSPTLKGKFNDDIELDYSYNSMEYIKSFAFNYERQTTAIDLAKGWAFTFSELRQKDKEDAVNFDDRPNKRKFVSVVHVESRNKQVNTALEIISSESKLFFANEVNKVAEYFKQRIEEDDPQMRLEI